MEEVERNVAIIKRAFDDLYEEGTIKISGDQISPETRLYGSDNSLDSLDLVQIIVRVEDIVEKEYEQSITLANDDAMSRAKSPFLNVELLAKYINELTENDQ